MENLLKYAQLFEILSEGFKGRELGKKATQKMFYFFERDGIQLDLKYGIHYYGPYSSKLDNVMHILESEDYLSIDTTGTTHKISLGNEHIKENVLTDEEVQKANFIIEKFAKCTPMELEADATMDFVANTLLNDSYSKNELINKFKEIKGTKFNDSSIEKTLKRLSNLDFIAI